MCNPTGIWHAITLHLNASVMHLAARSGRCKILSCDALLYASTHNAFWPAYRFPYWHVQ